MFDITQTLFVSFLLLFMTAMSSKEPKYNPNEKVHEVVVDSDSEVDHERATGATLKRTMKNRHIAMIRSVFPGCFHYSTLCLAYMTVSVESLAQDFS